MNYSSYEKNIKISKGSSDAPRYKALGNSIALPYWQHLMCRMSKYLPEDATLGSLFDGIGGFDLCWANIYGADKVRWSSEIEEFPIAVITKHFGDEDKGIAGDIDKFLGIFNWRTANDEEENIQ